MAPPKGRGSAAIAADPRPNQGVNSLVLVRGSVLALGAVGPKAYHPSFDDDQLMKLCLLMILCLISDRFIIKILVGA